MGQACSPGLWLQQGQQVQPRTLLGEVTLGELPLEGHSRGLILPGIVLRAVNHRTGSADALM